NDGGMRHVERAQRASVDDNVIGRHGKTSQRATHREHARLQDVEAIDLAYRRGADADSDRIRENFSDDLLAFFLGELLRVVDARHRATLRRHHNGTCDNGAREGTPSNFIDSSDQRTMLDAEITLDRAPTHGLPS